jgi:hypothetical protein
MLLSDKKKCPVCDSGNIKISKTPLLTKLKETLWPFRGETKNFNLCSDCSFSWED